MLDWTCLSVCLSPYIYVYKVWVCNTGVNGTDEPLALLGLYSNSEIGILISDSDTNNEHLNASYVSDTCFQAFYMHWGGTVVKPYYLYMWEMRPKKLRNFPKHTESVSGWAGIWTQAVWLQSLCSESGDECIEGKENPGWFERGGSRGYSRVGRETNLKIYRWNLTQNLLLK